MENKETKENSLEEGKQFLLKKDDNKHLALLVEFNKKLQKFLSEPQNEIKKDIQKIIQKHPDIFIARMQAGFNVNESMWLSMFDFFRDKVLISAMQDRYITPVIYYDDKDAPEEKKHKIIFIDPNDKQSLEKLDKINLTNEIKVYAHDGLGVSGQFSNCLHKALNSKKNNEYKHTYIVPINNSILAQVSSSVQTSAVENC